MTNPNHPAFLTEPKTFYLRQTPPDCDTQFGLTKREYFAAMAMQGLLARNTESPTLTINGVKKYYEESAVIFADALIEALNK